MECDNDAWTNELTPPVPNCSFYTNGQFKVFEWTLDAYTISGFFSPVNQNATQFIVDQCLNHGPTRHAMPQTVIEWLRQLTNQTRQILTAAAHEHHSNHYHQTAMQSSFNNAQIGIVLCHDAYYYTSTIGCQLHMYPPIEQSRFSTEIDISGPHQILYRGVDTLNFLVIISRGLINFLQQQQNRNPIMYLSDGVKNQLEMCRTSGNINNVSNWTIESVQRDYGKMPIDNSSLLMVHRFQPPKFTLQSAKLAELPQLPPQMINLHIGHSDQNATNTTRDYPIPTAASSIGQTIDSEYIIGDDVMGTAPPVSPISRVTQYENDPRNIEKDEVDGDEHRMVSVKAHVADSFAEFADNFEQRFPGVATMAELWKSPQLRFTDTQ